MDLGLEGRVAVVTGASLGIGAATVSRLAAEGASVAFCARTTTDVEALAERVGSNGKAAKGYSVDMSQATEIDAFIASVQNDLGPIDVLVNNVGSSPSRNFLYMADDDWRELFELNLMSAVRCSRLVIPPMRERGDGRIVMISSAAAKYPTPDLIDYSASKAAMIAVGKALANKYGRDGVLVNSVLPGLVDTPMWDRATQEISDATGREPEAIRSDIAKDVPVGRYGHPEEVADVVTFLCSSRASYINGTTITVDGGAGSDLL